MAVTSVITSASNSSVKPEPLLAHGTAICLTPQSGQLMRATRACRKAWCWKKSRCRHSCMAVSCTGQSALPHCGHGKRPPLAKSISISRRRAWASNAHAFTIHGGTSPSASCIRSVSRIEVSPAVPVRLDPAAVLDAVKVRPGNRGACLDVGVTADLDSICARRLPRTAGRGGEMVPDRTKRWDWVRHQAELGTSPTPNSEEAQSLSVWLHRLAFRGAHTATETTPTDACQ